MSATKTVRTILGPVILLLAARTAHAQATTTTTTTTTTAAAPTPAVAPFMDASIGFVATGRHLNYTDDLFGALRSYDLFAAPGITARGEFYPGALFTHSIAASVFGVVGGGDIEFPAPSVDMAGNSYATMAHGYFIGVRARAPIPDRELHDLGFEIDYGAQRFQVSDGVAGQNGGVPNAGYIFVRTLASGRVGFGSRFFASWRAGYDFVTTAGSVAATYFPHARVSAVEFGVGVGLRIALGLEVRADFNFRHYWYWINPQPGDNLSGAYVAGGATDDYPSGTLALAWRQ